MRKRKDEKKSEEKKKKWWGDGGFIDNSNTICKLGFALQERKELVK